jgi:hypothetical protein
MPNTMDLYEQFAGLIDEFAGRRIDYAVIGGIAVAIHGYARFTKDIDLLVRKEDLDRVREAARARGFTIEAGFIPFGVGTAHANEFFRISKIEGRQLLSLDLMIVSAEIEDVWRTRGLFPLENRSVLVVSPDGLKKLKLWAGRDQDLLDLKKLGLLHADD